MVYESLEELFKAICNSIRAKEGSTNLIDHQSIPSRIDALNGLEAEELSDIHIWKKSTATEEYTVTETETANVNLSYYNPADINDWDTVSYADEIKVVSGEITLVNPVSITLNSTSDRSVLLGKYVYSGNTKLYYRIPEDTSITYTNSTYGTTEYIRASVAMKLAVSTTEVDGGELIGYVVSSDKADYPENGNVGDGYKYVYIGTAESNEGLDTSDATAVADDILKGKTAYANGRKITGTHECVGDTSETVEQATPTIEVSNSGLITATAEQIAGYVKAGTKSATKQLTTQAAKTYTPGTSDQTIASGKYLTGDQTIEGDSNLVASNIKSGVSIFGVAGSYEGENTGGSSGGYVIKTGTVTDSATIETGLSHIKQIMIYITTGYTSKGLISYIWNEDIGGVSTYCSYYSTYSKTVTHVKTGNNLCNGGTYTHDGSSTVGNDMASGVEYTWVAIGEE